MKLTKTATRRFLNLVQGNDLDRVKAELAEKPSLLHAVASSPPKKNDGQSALQLALKSGAFDVAEHLVEAGIDVNFMETESVHPWRAPVLHDAIMASMLARDAARARGVLRKVLAAGADANARDSYGNDPLNRALLDSQRVIPSEENDAKVVGVLADLLEHGADPQASSETRPAVDADQRGKPSYRYLVQAQGGADDWRGAVWRDDPAGLTGNESPDPAGRTPLMTAVIFGSIAVFGALLDQGVEVDAVDHAGWTALGLSWWSPPMTKRLLEQGANPNQVLGDSGSTPFTRTFYQPELAELMLKHGADRDARNRLGKSLDDARAESRVG